MDEVDFYMLNVGEYMIFSLLEDFLESVEKKGYTIEDIGQVWRGGIFIRGFYYKFGEIDEVPFKDDGNKSRLEKCL